jgi:hypothetical protein
MEWLKSAKTRIALHQRLLLAGLPVICYILRAWPYIRHPQLFAEDGAEWLTFAHNHPFQSLYMPYEGFLHTFERVWADLLSLLPLAAAPFAYNLSALLIFSLLCYYLFSKRCNLFSSTYQMVFFSISLSLVDNIEDFYFNFSNSVFLLGMIGACLIVAKAAKIRTVRILETILFGLMCFTLPFAWVYVLMLAGRWWFEKKPQYIQLALAVVGGAIQLGVHLFANDRPQTISILDLHTRPALLVFYNQMIVPAFRFVRIDIATSSINRPSVYLMLVLSIGACIALTLFAFRRANTGLRYVIAFFAAMTIAVMSNPQITAKTAREGYTLLSITVGGSRYWIFGILLLFMVFAVASEAMLTRKYRYYIISIFFATGLLSAMRDHRLLINKHLVDYSQIYKEKIRLVNEPGAPVEIIENPNHLLIILDRPKVPQPNTHR